MIVSLRGTHGSGKSTVVRSILGRYPAAPEAGPGPHPLGYAVAVPWLRLPLYVVGSYRNACGGCDAIQPYAEIWPRVVRYAAAGHVLFEGALVSSSYGNIGRASEAYGDDVVFAFMDTPLEVCLERIRARRRARGDERPLNPTITTGKYNSCLRSVEKIRNEFGRRVVVLDHRKAVPQLLGLIRSAEGGGL